MRGVHLERGRRLDVGTPWAGRIFSPEPGPGMKNVPRMCTMSSEIAEDLALYLTESSRPLGRRAGRVR